MKPIWRTRDVIDLEYFLKEDNHADDAAIARRDRDIYLREVLPVLKKGGSPSDPDRKMIIRIWLEGRKRQEMDSTGKNIVFPGKIFADIFTMLIVLFMVTGGLTGSGLAVAFLRYQGTEPINVSHFFGVFVIFQSIWVSVLALFIVFRPWFQSPRHISFFPAAFGQFMAWVFRKAATQAMDKVSSETRNRLAAVAGIIKGQNRIYGPVFYWALFVLAQLFGIGFNLGVIGGSLLRIVSTDLAFGWQSTIQFSSGVVYTFVKIFSLPWSWIGPLAIVNPTYAQIQGSRMVLKDGIYHLATPDLVSWWPFLLLSVVCYGFLPRIILFCAGIAGRRRAMNKLDFGHEACNRLLRRLNTPILETDGRMISNDYLNRSPQRPEPEDPPDSGELSLQGHDAFVLVPDDISGWLTNEVLEMVLKKRLGINIKKRINVFFDIFEDTKALTDSSLSRPLDDKSPVIILQEAWQPPIAETLLYFQKLRQILGSKTQIHIFLIGRASSDNRLTDVGHGDWKVWKTAVQALGDPFLEISGSRIV